MDVDGAIPDYIPELKNADPDAFAVSICTVDGQVINLGNTKEKVTMHALSNVVSYLIALEQLGEEELKKYIGSEPSGHLFNSLELMSSGIPHNPLNCAGGLMSSALIYPGNSSAKKYESYEKFVHRLIGNRKVQFNNEMFLCEMDTAHANYATLYELQGKGTLPENSDVKNTLKFYTQTCALDLRIKDYALLGATLANGGICPMTDERCAEDSEAVKLLLSQMLSTGMNTQSGKWVFDVGLPTKSSVSGLLLMVIPNTCGICVYAPKLNKYFNSAKGEVFLKKFVEKFNYSDTDHQYAAGKMTAMQMKGLDNKDDNIHLLYQAEKGDLKEIRRSIAIGRRINYHDYDDRTALHLACNHGHFNVVKYLINHGARMFAKDRFGNSPCDEAKMNGHDEIYEYLSNQK
jgi:glutaminase